MILAPVAGANMLELLFGHRVKAESDLIDPTGRVVAGYLIGFQVALTTARTGVTLKT